ncbi:hypothetical protein ACHAPU_006022 [Fusarium lateritium]
MVFWYDICWDIRHEILLQLERVVSHENLSSAKLACVSKEWQMSFERRSFRSLQITVNDVQQFQTVFSVYRRRKYLQHLDLKLDLPRQKGIRHSGAAGTEEEVLFVQMLIISRQGPRSSRLLPWIEAQQDWNNQIFRDALRRLFGCLASWTTEQAHCHGITLEIIADSESYWQEAARKLRQHIGPLEVYTSTLRVVDSQIRDRVLSAAELDFNFSVRLCQMGWRTVPAVQVISGLSILRKSVRHFSPTSVGYILQSLPRLEAFTWDVRPHGHSITAHRFCEELRENVCMWPKSLKRVEITQLPRTSPILRPKSSCNAAGSDFV